MINIDTLVEIWVAESRARRAESLLARMQARHAAEEDDFYDFSWWREAMANLRPPPKDDEPLEDA
jgi:hypothetical protein